MKKLMLISLVIFLCIPWVNALGGNFTLNIDTKDGHEMIFYADRGRFKSQIIYKNKVKEVRGYYAVLFDTIYFFKSSRHILTNKDDFELHEFLRENKKLAIYKLKSINDQLIIRKISEDPRLGVHILNGQLNGRLAYISKLY